MSSFEVYLTIEVVKWFQTTLYYHSLDFPEVAGEVIDSVKLSKVEDRKIQNSEEVLRNGLT